MKTGLTKQHKKRLLELARNTIANDLGLEEPKFKDEDFSEKIFREKRGVFVTLELYGNLRGCIGNIEPVYPLFEAVKRNAHEAAFEDPRFDPLASGEFPDIEIEISVLTIPPGRVREGRFTGQVPRLKGLFTHTAILITEIPSTGHYQAALPFIQQAIL